MGIGRVAMVLAVVALAGLSGCSNDGVPGDVRTAWEAYVAVLKSGDEAAARALFTEESAPYFEINDSAAVREVSYRLVKVEPHESFYRLHVIEERQGTQKARFFYLVKQGDALRFEFPFILLAADWPTVKSSHITFHVPPNVGNLYDGDARDSVLIDTVPYEKFVSRVTRITNLVPATRLELYLCRDSADVNLLSGRKDVFCSCIGPCLLTSRANDLSNIATFLLRQDQGLELLRLGLIGYGEHERIALDSSLHAKLSLYHLCSPYLSRLTSDSLDVFIDNEDIEEPASADWSTFSKSVAAALVSELVRRDSADMLATLYRSSHNGSDFRQLFDSLYGEEPYTMLMELKAEYATALEEGMKAWTDAQEGEKK